MRNAETKIYHSLTKDRIAEIRRAAQIDHALDRPAPSGMGFQIGKVYARERLRLADLPKRTPMPKLERAS